LTEPLRSSQTIKPAYDQHGTIDERRSKRLSNLTYGKYLVLSTWTLLKHDASCAFDGCTGIVDRDYEVFSGRQRGHIVLNGIHRRAPFVGRNDMHQIRDPPLR
jgi:hypothetical protein